MEALEDLHAHRLWRLGALREPRNWGLIDLVAQLTSFHDQLGACALRTRICPT